jgi:hypothetical protein
MKPIHRLLGLLRGVRWLAPVLFLACAQHLSAEPVKPPASFRFREIDDKSIALWDRDRPVLVFNFGTMTATGVPAAGSRACYFHPIYGLDGEVLTDDFPKDHYHHHGLFWGWPHVKIGDREYDLWKMRGIRIEFRRWLDKQADTQGARLEVENAWVVRGKPVMKEEVSVQVSPATADSRTVDLRIKWTPLEPITLMGAEEKSYGGVTLRFAPRTGTTITVPSGRAAHDLLMIKLPWADLSATFAGAKSASGIALFVSPQNPDFPPEWMTRDYGILAVGWPGVQEVTLTPDKPVTCSYRLWIHRGVSDASRIQKEFAAFSKIYAESVPPE